MKDLIRERALALGFDSCGFTTAEPPGTADAYKHWIEQGRHGTMGYLERNAAKRVDPRQVLAGAKSVIALATSYSAPGAGSGPIARYARFDDYHEVLATRLKELTQYVDSIASAGTRSLWYVDTGPLLERDLAQRAGVGFAGKHTNLISRQLGNWFFISEIITTAEISPDLPEKNRCGSCSRCITACPTAAITGPFQLDARRCISYLTIELKSSIPVEFRQGIGNRIYGCDVCLEACPWNRFAKEGALMRPHHRPDLAESDLVDLLQLDEAGFKQKFRGTPMLRTKRRGVLRNVCVALGNVGTPQVIPHLERSLQDIEPLISEHAAWAIAEIRRRFGL